MEFLHLLGGGSAFLLVWAFIFVEETGVPLPLPGDAVVLTGGYLAAVHGMPIFLFLPVGYLCSVTGAAVCYLIFRKLGRAVLVKHGGKVQLTAKRLERAENLLNRWALPTIGIARMLPGLRINASMVAGSLNVPFRRFYGTVLVSTIVWLSTFSILGYLLGTRVQAMLPWLDKFGATSTMVLIVAALVNKLRSRSKGHEPAT